MLVEPLVDQPSLTQPPTKSYWIATTQRHINSKKAGGIALELPTWLTSPPPLQGTSYQQGMICVAYLQSDAPQLGHPSYLASHRQIRCAEVSAPDANNILLLEVSTLYIAVLGPTQRRSSASPKMTLVPKNIVCLTCTEAQLKGNCQIAWGAKGQNQRRWRRNEGELRCSWNPW